MLPDMSPQGQTLTFTRQEWRRLCDLHPEAERERAAPGHAPPNGSGDFRSRWSPKGHDLVFMRDDGTELQRRLHGASGRRRADAADFRTRFEEQAQFSPDGTKVLFSVFDSDGSARMHTIRRDGTGEQALPRLGGDRGGLRRPWARLAMWWTALSGTGGTLTQTSSHAELSLASDAVNDPVPASWARTSAPSAGPSATTTRA